MDGKCFLKAFDMIARSLGMVVGERLYRVNLNVKLRRLRTIFVQFRKAMKMLLLSFISAAIHKSFAHFLFLSVDGANPEILRCIMQQVEYVHLQLQR